MKYIMTHGITYNQLIETLQALPKEHLHKVNISLP
jgi:hypothetical protein